MNEKDIVDLIKKDDWMMSVLETVKKLNLPDWWIGAGFVRSKVWDYLHDYKTRTPIPDIDVIYFDKKDFSKDEEKIESTSVEDDYQEKLKNLMPGINWSVINQARMHSFHNHQPYKTSEEGLSYWVETATCIGVKINPSGNLVLTTPHGISDLANLVLRPTPGSYKDIKKFEERVSKKEWLKKWPKLKVDYKV